MSDKFSVRFVADNDEARARGLMHAEPLREDEAVLFTFPRSDRFAFWNKNVSFGLSLAFLDENGRVVDMKDLDAESTKQVGPCSDARFVVEASRGAFERLGVNRGDFIIYRENSLEVKRVNS